MPRTLAEPRDAETPESLLIRSDEQDALRALIAALPVQYREVLVLREIDQLSYREIAAAIDAPTGTVMSRLARARERLAAAWRGAARGRKRRMSDCGDARLLLHGLIDGELDAANALAAKRISPLAPIARALLAEMQAARPDRRGRGPLSRRRRALRARIGRAIGGARAPGACRAPRPPWPNWALGGGPRRLLAEPARPADGAARPRSLRPRSSPAMSARSRPRISSTSPPRTSTR